jgi:hypothetical protein
MLLAGRAAAATAWKPSRFVPCMSTLQASAVARMAASSQCKAAVMRGVVARPRFAAAAAARSAASGQSLRQARTVCAAAATAEPETFQYQAEVRCGAATLGHSLGHGSSGAGDRPETGNFSAFSPLI